MFLNCIPNRFRNFFRNTISEFTKKKEKRSRYPAKFNIKSLIFLLHVKAAGIQMEILIMKLIQFLLFTAVTLIQPIGKYVLG